MRFRMLSVPAQWMNRGRVKKKSYISRPDSILLNPTFRPAPFPFSVDRSAPDYTFSTLNRLNFLPFLFGVLIWVWPQTAQAASQVLNAELSGKSNPATFFVDPTPVEGGPAGTFAFTAEFCNVGHKQLRLLKSVTIVLTGRNVLLNRNPGTPPGVVSELTFPASQGSVDSLLEEGECVDVNYRIGLAVRAPFEFFVDVLGRASDLTQPFTFRIDPSIRPSQATLAGLSGGPPRPVGVAVGPDGARDEFVVNEVAFRPSSQNDLDAFLRQYGGTVLRDTSAMIITESGVSFRPSPFDNTYLIRVDLTHSPLDDLARNMSAAGITGDFTFSSEDATRLASLLAREAGRDLSPNIVAHLDCSICEHPDGKGGNLDAAEFWWLTDDENVSAPGDQGLSVGVIRAWEYLRYMGLPPPPPGGSFSPSIVAIIDSGFDLDPQTGEGNLDYQFVLQGDLIDRDRNAGGPNTDFGLNDGRRWHGQSVFGAAAAVPSNGFGSAGTGGEVVRPMLIRIDLTTDGLARAVQTAILSGADVINMSLGGGCNIWCQLWDSEHPLQSNLGWARNNGIVPVAAAGNDMKDTEDTPCAMNAVICVGAIDRTGRRASFGGGLGSNFGKHVDIWAPTCFLSTVTPISANADADNVGENELDTFCGTSASAPFVAGIVGLMKALDQSFELADQVEQILQDTANTPAITKNTSADTTVTPGWVDAFRAVAAARPNLPPTVNIMHKPSLSLTPRRPHIEADVQDPEPGGALPGAVVVRFSSNRDGVLCVDQTQPFSCAARLSVGTHVITATATDPFDGQGSASLTLSVTNVLPTATITSPIADIRVSANQFVNFQGQGFDADAEAPVSMTWRSSQVGVLGTGNSIIVRLPVGQHTVTLTARDADGATAGDSVVVTVVRGEGQPGIDLVPVRNLCAFASNIHRLVVTVGNQGDTDAPASNTRIDPTSATSHIVSTPPIAAGKTVDLPPISLPGCSLRTCNFIVTVDYRNQLNEANEANNSVPGRCQVAE